MYCTARLAKTKGTLQAEITKRIKAEKDLREARVQNEQLLASISSILISVNEDDKITQWNRMAEKTFGIVAKDVVGRPFPECGINWEWASIIEGISVCRRKRESVQLDDVRFTRVDRKEGFLRITLNPIICENSRSPGILLLGADITEHRILESQLIQSQKLELIGQLAAGIAHEINTPTQYVGDNTRFLQEAFSGLNQLFEKYGQLLEAIKRGAATDDLAQEIEDTMDEVDIAYVTEEIPKAIQQTLEGVERVTEIVQAMRNFSHPGTEEKTTLDINKAIQSTITVARNEWKYVAEAVTHLDRFLPLVPCLPGEFNQVILNILINAVHAISDVVGDSSQGKGTITVSTRRDGDWAEIRINDTGTGIPKEIRPRIFDPFFTTKELGRGTGQGLAIAHDVVVKKHGGTITFETEMSKGATFIIRLPLSDQVNPKKLR